MKKEDMNTAELFLEAICIVAVLIYGGLQFYYGIIYGVAVWSIQILMKLAVILLTYAGLSLLQCYPEYVNGLGREACTKDVRKYTIRMLRFAKLIFILSLLFTSILDVMGKEINEGYSMVSIVLIAVTVIFYESKILRIIRDQRKK